MLKKVFVVAISVMLMVSCSQAEEKRIVEVIYTVDVSDIEGENNKVRMWVPYPVEDENQKITDFRVTGAPGPVKLNTNNDWGNGIIYYEGEVGSGLNFQMAFTAERSAIRKDSYKAEGVEVPLASKEKLELPRVEKYYNEAVGKKTDKYEIARAIYDYVLEKMEYNKVAAGAGEGDVGRICIAIDGGETGKGNCTDYHSFFAALARHGDIPVAIEMGIPMVKGESGTINEGAYHCWAKFYIEGKGWVPIDISEADKNSSAKDFYFGSLDRNRLSFSVGDDVILTPKQEGSKLKLFGPDPYIEINGKPYYDFKRKIIYKNI